LVCIQLVKLDVAKEIILECECILVSIYKGTMFFLWVCPYVLYAPSCFQMFLFDSSDLGHKMTPHTISGYLSLCRLLGLCLLLCWFACCGVLGFPFRICSQNKHCQMSLQTQSFVRIVWLQKASSWLNNCCCSLSQIRDNVCKCIDT